MTEQIQQYWDNRAAGDAKPTATTNDIHLRNLEIRTFADTIRSLGVSANGLAIDVGCGDGYSTLRIADALGANRPRYIGVDYADAMIARANDNAKEFPHFADRIEFRVGDAMKLDDCLGDTRADVITTDRCLINLDTPEKQARAITEIARHIKPGGHYLAIENFMEGQQRMNEARARLGLGEIPVRWHNRFFTEDEFTAAAKPFFDEIKFVEFSSSYYLATRVLYSAMCKKRGEEPDYDHDIHRLAVDLPQSGSFSPIRLVILRRKSK